LLIEILDSDLLKCQFVVVLGISYTNWISVQVTKFINKFSGARIKV
jgi:hypothetical protein